VRPLIALLALTASCAGSVEMTREPAAIGSLEITASSRSFDIDLRRISVMRAQAAVAVHDPYGTGIRIERSPAPVDSWVFATQRLSRKDHKCDTIGKWVVILRFPAGLVTGDPNSLEGSPVEFELATEHQQPPMMHLVSKGTCRLMPWSHGTFEVPFAIDDSHLGKGVFRFRVVESEPFGLKLE